MNDEKSQINSILTTLQQIMPKIIDSEMKGETESKTESETRVFPAVGPNMKDQEEKTGTDTDKDTTAVTDTNNEAAIVVDGHSFLNTPLADNEIRKEEYTIVMKPDGNNEIIDSQTKNIELTI